MEQSSSPPAVLHFIIVLLADFWNNVPHLRLLVTELHTGLIEKAQVTVTNSGILQVFHIVSLFGLGGPLRNTSARVISELKACIHLVPVLKLSGSDACLRPASISKKVRVDHLTSKSLAYLPADLTTE